jgi:hypothetical protein
MKSSAGIFGGAYCNIGEVVAILLRKGDFRLLTDMDIIETVAHEHHSPINRLEKVFSSDRSEFNRFIHERRFYIAQIKQVLARHLSENESLLIKGFGSQLIPRKVTHNLKVCLIAEPKHRVAKLQRSKNLSEDEAIGWIQRSDEECVEWIRSLHQTNDPWDPALYDIVAQADQLPSAKVADLIIENLTRSAAQPTESSVSAVNDFLLAAKIEMLMLGSGHDVQVTAESGAVEIILNRRVLMRDRLIAEIEDRLEKMPAIKSYRVVSEFSSSDSGRTSWISEPSLPDHVGR